MKQLAVEPCCCTNLRPTQRTRAFGNRVEHRRHIGGRLADNAQDISGCRLLLECFPGLVEQPRVLDRDDGFSGETCR
jgi:hypothetical protein